MYFVWRIPTNKSMGKHSGLHNSFLTLRTVSCTHLVTPLNAPLWQYEHVVSTSQAYSHANLPTAFNQLQALGPRQTSHCRVYSNAVYCLPVHEGVTVQQLHLEQDSKITKNVNWILTDYSSVSGCKILVSHNTGRKQVEGVWHQGAEEYTWAMDGWRNRRWEEIHNEELHDLYFLINSNGVRKSRRKRQAGDVVRMEEMRG